MDENRLEGAAREVGGMAQEGVGRLAGNARLQAEGAINQAAGRAQNLYGQTADTARETATTLDSWFRNALEQQPYATAMAVLAAGWLLGRLHRPL